MINTTGLHHINEPFHYDELLSWAVSHREEPLLRRGTESDLNIFFVFFSDDVKKTFEKKKRGNEREKERKSTAVVCLYLFRLEILRWAQNPPTLRLKNFARLFGVWRAASRPRKNFFLWTFFAVYGRSYLAAYHAVRLYSYIYDISAVYWIALMPAAACLGCRWAGSAAEEKEKGKSNENRKNERKKEKKKKTNEERLTAQNHKDCVQYISTHPTGEKKKEK